MSDTNSTVEYRDIKGFPGYRVGNDGSVWSRWKRVGKPVGRGTRAILGGVWKRMVTKPDARGRYTVTLIVNKNRVTKRIHNLVLEAFVGPRPLGLQACHFPERDHKNSSLKNLRWDTPQSNCADKVIHGTAMRGEKNHFSKLTLDQVKYAISALKSKTRTRRQLANELGVCKATIHAIAQGKNWKYLPR